ncbi:MAG: cell division protein FtsZ [Kiloniellaceae bacterium]
MKDTPEHPPKEAGAGPRIVVVGVGGAGGNAVNNMIQAKLGGVEFLVANTDAQALGQSLCERRIQMGRNITQGLGAGSRPDVGRSAAEEALEEILAELDGANMVFITAGMGGGTGTGCAPVIARALRETGILTVGVVTKPFHFEGARRMGVAEVGIAEMTQYVDTLIVIPNQNLFRVADEKTTFADAFKMADEVLHAGVRGVTDLMVTPGLINLDFADVRSVMTEMGKAIMGTGEAEGENRALAAAEAAISNPLLDEVSMKGARGVLINITGGMDLTLFEIDQAANRIRDEIDPEANIIFGSIFDQSLEGRMRVSVVAAGIDAEEAEGATSASKRLIVSLYAEASDATPRGGDRSGEATEASVAAPGSDVAAPDGPEAARPDAPAAENPKAGAPEEPPVKASAPIFPFRARSKDRKASDGQGKPDRSAKPHPVTGQSSVLRPVTAQSVATDEGDPADLSDETTALPDPTASAEGAPTAETAPPCEPGANTEPDQTQPVTQGPAETTSGAVRRRDGKERPDTPAKPELVLTAETAIAPGAKAEPVRDGPPGLTGSQHSAIGAGRDTRHRKSNAFFSWIAGGGGSADELFKKGDRHYHGQGVRKNLTLAFRSYLKAAEMGHPGAQNRVGWMYEKGEGIEADHGQAVRWYRSAAEQGYVNAMNDLGYMYRQGWGVPQSYTEALDWFAKAAAKYDSYAEYNMGQMYENGWGVEKNMDEAIRWFRRSAARGHEWAAKRLEELGVKT